MKTSLLLLSFLLVSFLSYAQSQTKDYKLYEEVATKPEYVGGEGALYVFIGSNIDYPADARNKLVTGKVNVSFVVQSTGEVDDNSVKVIESLWPSLDKEAIRVVRNFPNWKPGADANENNVDVLMILPIAFALDASQKQLDNAKKRREKKEAKKLSKANKKVKNTN
ncbi:MAG: energy transducer TonB [Bacteroidota bacterium]